jgi:mycofactocin system transcriptional regulator
VPSLQDLSSPLRGRPPTTTRADVARVALELFAAKGYEQTTVDEIAAAAGVGRRTLFRYYASKPDIVWGDFSLVIGALRGQLAAAPAGARWFGALRGAIVASNRYDAAELDTLRIRMRLIGSVPALESHSLRRYEQWRGVVSEFVAERRGEHPHDLIPRLVSASALGTAMAAFAWWAEHGGDHLAVLGEALQALETGFAA